MRPGNVGLYDPMNERDSCGVGLALNIDGTKSHRIVEYGLRILDNMEHRGAENADGKTGDGTGITVSKAIYTSPGTFKARSSMRSTREGTFNAAILL